MSDTTFQSLVTPITTTWAQDVNNTVYRAIGTGPGGTAPTTAADVRANLGLTASGGASKIGFTPSGAITATDVQTAILQAASGAANLPMVPITAFGAVGDGVTENDTAFIAAEANPAKNIFLPQGTYKVTGVTLTKKYYGEGRIYLDGTYYGQEYSNITTAPVSTNPSNYGIDGDITHVDVGSYTLGNVRNGLTAPYFNAPTTPVFARFSNYGGHSGIDCIFTANAAIGAGSITVNSVPTDVTNGTVLGLTNGANPVGYTETVVVSGVVGNVISFTPTLANAYVVGDKVAVHTRTMNQQQFSEVNHYGGGDAYCWTGRMAVWGTTNRQAGQNHFYATSTGGIIGGDLSGGKDGVYLTSTEFNMLDTTYLGNSNISAISHVNSFQRTTDPRASITTTLSSSPSIGATSFTVSSGTGMLSSGGTVTIISSASSETVYVSSVSGTTVNLLNPLTYAHTAGDTVIYQASCLRTTLSSGASAGAPSIVVANNAGIAAGTSVLTITDGAKTAIQTVANVAGTTITLGNALQQTFSSGAAVLIQNTTNNPYGTTWIGALFKSESTKSCDAIITGIGKWKTGINFTNADFSNNAQAAIQLKKGHRIYFNSYASSDVNSTSLWGDYIGDTYIGINSQTSSLQTWVGNVLVSETDGTYQYFSKIVSMRAGGAVASGTAMKYDGPTGNTYQYWDGTYLRSYAAGVNVLSCSSSEVNVNSTLSVNNSFNIYSPTTSASATAGPSSALPATPYTYVTIKLNGTSYKIPVYNV